MKIVLKPYFSRPVYGADLRNARLRIEVVEAVDITKYIFLHESYVTTVDTGNIVNNRFIAVAKPGDIEMFPVNKPAADVEPPYFRTECVDLIFNSPDIMDVTFKDLVSEVTLLVQSMKHIQELEVQDYIIIEG